MTREDLSSPNRNPYIAKLWKLISSALNYKITLIKDTFISHRHTKLSGLAKNY